MKTVFLTLSFFLFTSLIVNAQFVAPAFQGTNFLSKNLNNALDFDGVDDYVITTLDVNYSVMPITTWEAWVYPTENDATWRTIFGIEDLGWDRNLFINGGRFVAGYGCADWNITNIDLNQWQHIALVYDEANGRMVFYKNGVQFNYTFNSGCTHSSAVKFAIGSSQQNGPNQFFKGKISEVRVWNKERTQAEILANMNLELSGEESGLVSYFPFRQGSPNQTNTLTTLYDEVGGYHGTITNFSLTGNVSNFTYGKVEARVPKNNLVTYLDAGLVRSYSGSGTSIKDISGNSNHFTVNAPVYSADYGGVLNFNGSSSTLNIATAPISGANKRTIAFWIFPRSFTNITVDNLLSAGSQAYSGGAFGLWVNSNNMLYFWGHGADFTNSNLFVKMNEWNFIAITYNGNGKLTLHVNGVSNTANVTLNTVATSLIFKQYMIGAFAEMLIYDRDLSPSDLAYVYNQNKSKFPPPDGLTQNTAAASAQAIKAAYPTATDGVYWIYLPTVGPKQVYCLMDSKYNGGGWMMAMKSTQSTTFSYDAAHWNTTSTLNPTDLTRNNADAKYDVMNYYAAKDIMAIWPDIANVGTESGSIDSLTNWTWLQNSFHNSGATTTLISKFAASPTQSAIETSTNGTISFSGYGTPFSKQGGYMFYGFNYIGNSAHKVRWGISWNNEADQATNDVSLGIGMSARSYSAGDAYGCCGTYTGIDRSARVEIFVR